ncbi:hypothetical protein [Streptomyces sp. NPDC001274]
MNDTTTRPARPADGATGPVRLGLRENAAQFALLVVVNVAVGGLVGLEPRRRTARPPPRTPRAGSRW